MRPCRILYRSICSYFFKPVQQPKIGVLVQFLGVDRSAGTEHHETRSGTQVV